METLVLRPTATQRVRQLLAAGGAEVKPWVSLDETYASLYRLMAAKRDDETFWIEVEKLLGELVRDSVGMNGRLPAPGAEILKSWDIEDLVRDLRKALPNGTPADPAGFKRFSAGLAAPVLGGVLLLGLALSGCEGDTEWADGCGLDETSVIFDTIEDAEELTTREKAELCVCFSSFQPDWQDNLSALFKEFEPEGVAAVLEQMVEGCREIVFEDDDASPAYKGVSFPTEKGR